MDTDSQDWQTTYSTYWKIVRLSNSGRCSSYELAPVKAWLKNIFQNLHDYQSISNLKFQDKLLFIYQARQQKNTSISFTQTDISCAQLSLRCYISHQIRNTCFKLAEQFGMRYNFGATELFRFVLDDDGQLTSRYRPFSLDILDSYDRTKAQLNTWVSLRTKNHKELDLYLLSKGIYRASDWAILNHTSVTQLQRILREYFQWDECKIVQSQKILELYHDVYRQDRLNRQLSGTGRRCRPPTSQQLLRMDPQKSSEILLSELRTLATQLRQYRIHVRNGHPMLYRNHETDWEQLFDRQPQRTDFEEEQNNFLEAFRQVLKKNLGHALTQVIQANIEKLKKKKPPRDRSYVKGLQLFHCEGMSMGKMAPLIGLSNQVQVNRLLKLKRLRADVRYTLIPQLKDDLQIEALKYVTADRLREIDKTLDSLLAAEVDEMIRKATAEAQIPKGRTAKSLFAYQLCQTIHQFMSEYQ